MSKCFCGNDKDDKVLLCNACITKENQYLEAKYARELGIKSMNEPEKKEQVNHPKHYNTGKFEVIDVIEDWQVDFHIGNVIKYVSRAGRKADDTEIQDLKKALWYLQRKIELLEKK
jgi:hypothetical protein